MKTLIIGAGPSLKHFNQLETIAKSNFKGQIMVTDFTLKNALEAGITPDKFEMWTYATEDALDVMECLQFPIIEKYGKQINCVVNSIHDKVKEQCEKLFKQVIEVKDDDWTNLLGNVGDIALYVCLEILKCEQIGLVGFNHSHDEETFNKFPNELKETFWQKKTNGNEAYYLNPIYQYFTTILFEYLEENNHTIYNLTGEGALIHKNIIWENLENFIN